MAHVKNHDYQILPPSIWPFLGATAAFIMLTGAVAWMKGITVFGAPFYLAVSVVLNALFIAGGWRILQRTEEQAQADGYKVERRYFRLSLYYTFLHFLALLVQHGIGGW